MNQLERRYRQVLRMLPAAYRHHWEDDMVAAFLLSMQVDDPERAEYLADYGRPAWSEVASVAGLAIRLHLGLTGARTARADARSDAVRIVVLLWLLSGAVWAVVAAGVQLWLLGALRLMPSPPPEWTGAVPASPLQTALFCIGLAWSVAFVAILFGRSMVARIAALVGLANDGAVVISATVDELARNLPSLSVAMLVGLVVDAVLCMALWSTANRWRPAHRRSWLSAMALGVAAATAVTVVAIVGLLPWWVLDPASLGAAGVLAVVVVRLLIGGLSLSWSLALAVLTWGMAAVRVLTLPDLAEMNWWVGQAPMTLALGETVALVVAAVPITILAVRAQSRLAASR